MKVLDQTHFPLSFIWPINFLSLFGHPCSAGMTKHSTEVTEPMLIWSNKLISAPKAGLPLLCSFAEKPFLVTLAFWAALQDVAPTWAISGEERHSQGAAALLLPRAGYWEAPLRQWGGSAWGEQCSSVLIAFADSVERLDISSGLSHKVFGTSHLDHISVVHHRGNDVTSISDGLSCVQLLLYLLWQLTR